MITIRYKNNAEIICIHFYPSSVWFMLDWVIYPLEANLIINHYTNLQIAKKYFNIQSTISISIPNHLLTIKNLHIALPIIETNIKNISILYNKLVHEILFRLNISSPFELSWHTLFKGSNKVIYIIVGNW